MPKSIVYSLCACLLCYGATAQSLSIEQILHAVEQNNPGLLALERYQEGRRLELAGTNTLPDPQLGGYYMPFGEHSAGDYTEFEITQSFDFPGVYAARKGLNEQRLAAFDMEYQVKRQQLLTETRSHCLRLIYLNKRIDQAALRLAQAQEVYEQVQKLFEQEQVGILALNKARIAWMQEQFAQQELKSEKEGILILLQNLNGGEAIVFETDTYPGEAHLANPDSIWADKLHKDPALQHLQQQAAIAVQQLRLSRAQTLPGFSAGINRQGVQGAVYSGLYAGIRLPLWSKRHSVKAASLQLDYQQSLIAAKTDSKRAQFEKQCNDYHLRLSRFEEYGATLADIDSEALLYKAYQMGELSFLDYYGELQFYRQAKDALFEMEYELYRAQNELLNHLL